MPANLAAAAPSGVFPRMTFTAFSESRQFPTLFISSYHDSTIERSLIVDGVNPADSIRVWSATQRLRPAAITALKAFWDSHGITKPFYFYPFTDVTQGSQYGSNYDATGSNPVGRVTVVFRSKSWDQMMTNIARGMVSVELEEAA